MNLDRIIPGDPLTVLAQQVQSESIDLAIAMPPHYKVVKDYDQYVTCARLWLQAIHRALKPGHRLVWIVRNFEADTYRDGLHPFAHDSMWLATNVGFVLRDEIVWHDPADQERFPTGSWPYGPSACTRHTGLHHLLILQKPAVKDKYERYSQLRADLKPYNVMDTRFYSERMSRVVWEVHRDRNNDGVPEALAEPLIRMWSRPGDTVLDPFVRDGAVCATALTWKRHYLGVECDANRAKLAERNVQARMVQLLSDTR